jgi:hypothetical protein
VGASDAALFFERLYPLQDRLLAVVTALDSPLDLSPSDTVFA